MVARMDLHEVTTAATDTTDPVAGLRAMKSLRVLADRLELQQVEAALRAGLTWQEIAAPLGLTRQAVHRKYVKRIDPSIPVRRRKRS